MVGYQMSPIELRSGGRLKQENGSSSAVSGALRNARAGFENGGFVYGKSGPSRIFVKNFNRRFAA